MSHFELLKDAANLTLKGKQWCGYHKHFWEEWVEDIRAKLQDRWALTQISDKGFEVSSLMSSMLLKIPCMHWIQARSVFQVHACNMHNIEMIAMRTEHAIRTQTWHQSTDTQDAATGLSTHLPRDKMAAILQTIFSDAFLWLKSVVFWLKFHWCLFLRVQSTITQHWFR